MTRSVWAVVIGFSLALAGASVAQAPFMVHGADGKLIVSVEVTSGTVKVQAGDDAPITGVLKKDKRKYSAGGAPVAEVKFADDGFKLKGADGVLRWKVKYHEDRVKVSADEDQKDALELRSEPDGRVKVKRGEQELAEVRLDAARTTATVKAAGTETTCTLSGPLPRLAYGVLALKDVPAQDRAVLMGELVAAGK